MGIEIREFGVEVFAQNILLHGARFIPVTNATVTPTQAGTQLTDFRRDFMLVNAEQIRYLGGLETGKEIADPDVPGGLIG